MNPFSEAKINSLSIKNRFVRSATWEGCANEDGSVTDELISLYRILSKAEIGLIITGHAYVSREGKATPRQLGIYKDELISGLKKLTDEVHKEGGKIFIQLSHAGRFSRKELIGSDPININRLKKEEIERLIQAFCDSSERAKKAGFDGIQLHAAHGYLLNQFFSPFFNERDDEYGGSVRNRARFAERIVKGIRDRLGSDYPLILKMNCQDFKEGGLSLSDSIEIAKILEDSGIDGIEISGGLLISKKYGPCRTYKGPYFLKEALSFRENLNIPIFLVGGIRSFKDSEEIIRKGIDFVSMSRPFICEPDIVKRWKSGDLRDSLCFSDNLCFVAVKEKTPVRCIRKDEDKANI